MNSTRFNRNYWFFAVLFLSILFVGCKNQQKLADEATAQVKAENNALAKEILNFILNDDGQMTIAEKEKKLRQAKSLNSDDPEVQNLIAQVEAMIAREKEAENKTEEIPMPDPSLEGQLSELFGNIAQATNAETANSIIDGGLDLFNSPEAPVLIIISKSGDLKDYDQPTTISRYLNYLKDHKTVNNVVYDIKQDNSGKITELELIKKSIR